MQCGYIALYEIITWVQECSQWEWLIYFTSFLLFLFALFFHFSKDALPCDITTYIQLPCLNPLTIMHYLNIVNNLLFWFN